MTVQFRSRLSFEIDTRLLKALNRDRKLHTLKTQEPQNHTLFSGTYTFKPNKGVPPELRLRKAKFMNSPKYTKSQTVSVAYGFNVVLTNMSVYST